MLEGAVPDDFIGRCVTGLVGTPEKKHKTLQYLQGLSAQDEGFRALIRTVQLALLGSELSNLGKDLSGEYASIWQQIVEQVSGGRN